jgi:hypothetical protein
MTAPSKSLPVPICVIVGDVLGNYVFHHKTLEALFYGAGAGGAVPDGNCVTKCQSWLKRMHEDVLDPPVVLGKVLEEFMEVDNPYNDKQEPGRKKVLEALARFGLSYHQGGVIMGASTALPTKALRQILEEGVWGATEQKTGLRIDGYSSSGASALLRGRNSPFATDSGSANA